MRQHQEFPQLFNTNQQLAHFLAIDLPAFGGLTHCPQPAACRVALHFALCFHLVQFAPYGFARQPSCGHQFSNPL